MLPVFTKENRHMLGNICVSKCQRYLWSQSVQILCGQPRSSVIFKSLVAGEYRRSFAAVEPVVCMRCTSRCHPEVRLKRRFVVMVSIHDLCIFKGPWWWISLTVHGGCTSPEPMKAYFYEKPLHFVFINIALYFDNLGLVFYPDTVSTHSSLNKASLHRVMIVACWAPGRHPIKCLLLK